MIAEGEYLSRKENLSGSKEEKGLPKTVTLQHIETALERMFYSSRTQALSRCTYLQKLFLYVVDWERMLSGGAETTLGKVANRLQNVLRMRKTAESTLLWEYPIQNSVLIQIVHELSTSKLLISEHPKNGILQKIGINVSTDDIMFAVRNEDWLTSDQPLAPKES